jgi:hypothetical protein
VQTAVNGGSELLIFVTPAPVREPSSGRPMGHERQSCSADDDLVVSAVYTAASRRSATLVAAARM